MGGAHRDQNRMLEWRKVAALAEFQFLLEVTGDHYGARNLRLWQVILVWSLAMDLLIMALWNV